MERQIFFENGSFNTSSQPRRNRLKWKATGNTDTPFKARFVIGKMAFKYAIILRNWYSNTAEAFLYLEDRHIAFLGVVTVQSRWDLQKVGYTAQTIAEKHLNRILRCSKPVGVKAKSLPTKKPKDSHNSKIVVLNGQKFLDALFNANEIKIWFCDTSHGLQDPIYFKISRKDLWLNAANHKFSWKFEEESKTLLIY